jgi:hypothetical protein
MKMAIIWKYQHCEMFGRTRFFKADRCINNESIRAFNKNKIDAKEIVSFDSGLFDLEELRVYNNKDIAEQILLIMVRPDVNIIDKHLVSDIDTFTFCGYDLVEMDTCISAITNCGVGFDNAVDYGNLNEYGLVPNYLDVVKTQILLRDNYPDENHAYCEVVEVWRKLI